MADGKHLDEKQLNAQSIHFAQHYATTKGVDPSLTVKQKLDFLNAAVAGFYAGVRFVEENETKLYGKAETDGARPH